MSLRLFWAACLVAVPLRAGDRPVEHNAHGWYNYFGDHALGRSKWGVHLEGQFRRHDVTNRWQQLLLRPGVNYEVSPKLMLTAGYAFIRSHSYSRYTASTPAAPEHRIWEQAWFRYRSGRTAWTTRLRFENRFLGATDAAGARKYRFENRFRAWQQVRVPLSKRLYVTAYDEVWFFVKPYVSNSAFDQNRAYGAVGVNLSPEWRVEAGYMNQALLHRSGAALESNHTLVISIFSHARFGRSR
jgi:Protein of unknown function (DUF2490)